MLTLKLKLADALLGTTSADGRADGTLTIILCRATPND